MKRDSRPCVYTRTVLAKKCPPFHGDFRTWGKRLKTGTG
nr:MAG TPA: hypothetical protein [Caudoviricetes sp.]